ARSPLTDTPGSIQNIIKVVEGIREDDWAKVSLYGGTEVVKLAGKTLMRIFLPAPLAAALDPAVYALVQQRIDLFTNIMRAAKARDERRLGELAVEAFVTLNLPLVQACALFPSGAAKEVICGAAAEAVEKVADIGGKVVESGADKAEDAYNALQNLVSGRRDDCGTGDLYYDANFAFCKYHAAIAKNLDPARYAEMEGKLNNACRQHFEPCTRGIGIFETTSERISR